MNLEMKTKVKEFDELIYKFSGDLEQKIFSKYEDNNLDLRKLTSTIELMDLHK